MEPSYRETRTTVPSFADGTKISWAFTGRFRQLGPHDTVHGAVKTLNACEAGYALYSSRWIGVVETPGDTKCRWRSYDDSDRT